MIIDLERKRSRFSWKRPDLVPTLEERPNKKHDFSRAIWEFIFYGPDFSTDKRHNGAENSTTSENLGEILKTMKELQRQNASLQNKMMEIQNEFTLERNRRSREYIESSQDKHHACTQFRGYSESIEGGHPIEDSAENKRRVWGGGRPGSKHTAGNQTPDVLDLDDIVMTAEQDVFDDMKREETENDPELKELKQLHSRIDAEDYEDGNAEDYEDGNDEKTEADVDEETVGLMRQPTIATLCDDDGKPVRV
jgi:hypothetical protein